MKTKIFAIEDKAKTDKVNIRGSDLEAARLTTFEVTTLPLEHTLSKIMRDLLYNSWTDRGLLSVVHTTYLWRKNFHIYFVYMKIVKLLKYDED
jgi:hypothetical protein